MRILIVEDDTSLGFLLMEFLESENFDVKLCRDGESGLKTFQKHAFDLCLLDIMLPKMDGFTLAQKIRQINDTVPFLFLTARSMKSDKLKGFSIGAEDYITKPFDDEELLCRINVIMRRSQKTTPVESTQSQFKIGQYDFDYSLQKLCLNGQTLRLTEKENEVLKLLCLNENKILRREDAVEQIYGKKDYFLGRSFDVFISRLRKILKDDPRITIENVYNVGFIFKVGQETEIN
ncbi:MAG: DNA-binding response regulator [Bacteroidetes bacterium]|nr:MAG: DNA-binding response regulator [Bacteroidota bacterium]